MHFHQVVIRGPNWLIGTSIPLAFFFFIVAFMMSSDLPRLKQIDADLRVVKARLM
jgi:hypothetical protein